MVTVAQERLVEVEADETVVSDRGLLVRRRRSVGMTLTRCC